MRVKKNLRRLWNEKCLKFSKIIDGRFSRVADVLVRTARSEFEENRAELQSRSREFLA